MAVEQANVKGWGKSPMKEESASPRPGCEHPERWTMFDPETPEIEVLNFIRSFVKTVKPKRVVVCGDPTGELSRYIGHAVRENGMGHITICGVTDEAKDKVIGRTYGAGLGRWVTILEGDAMDTGSDLDLVVIDGADGEKRIGHFFPILASGGMIVAHDVTAVDLDVDFIGLPTPRGLALIQRK